MVSSVPRSAKVQVTVHMNAEEAYWLKCLMQNPMAGLHPMAEDERERKMRAKFWDALPSLEALSDHVARESGHHGRG